MDRWAQFGAVVAMATILVGCTPSPSGVYVAATSNQVGMVQLVQDEQGKLNGRFEEISLNSDGTLSSNAVAVEGAVDGRQIVFTAKQWGVTQSLTGELKPGQLILVAAGRREVLKKADLAAFESEVAKLRIRGQAIVVEREVGRARSYLAEADRALNAVESAKPQIAEKLELVKKHYADTDSTLRSAGKLAESLEKADRGFEASQVGAQVAVIRAERERTRMLFNGLRRDVNTRVSGAAAAIAEVKKLCRGDGSRQAREFSTVCEGVAAREDRLQAIVIDVRPQFVAADHAYDAGN